MSRRTAAGWRSPAPIPSTRRCTARPCRRPSTTTSPAISAWTWTSRCAVSRRTIEIAPRLQPCAGISSASTAPDSSRPIRCKAPGSSRCWIRAATTWAAWRSTRRCSRRASSTMPPPSRGCPPSRATRCSDRTGRCCPSSPSAPSTRTAICAATAWRSRRPRRASGWPPTATRWRSTVRKRFSRR